MSGLRINSGLGTGAEMPTPINPPRAGKVGTPPRAPPCLPQLQTPPSRGVTSQTTLWAGLEQVQGDEGTFSEPAPLLRGGGGAEHPRCPLGRFSPGRARGHRAPRTSPGSGMNFPLRTNSRRPRHLLRWPRGRWPRPPPPCMTPSPPRRPPAGAIKVTWAHALL